MTDEQIARLIERRDKLTNRRDGLTESKRIAAIDRQLARVEPGINNTIDLYLGRPGAVLPDYYTVGRAEQEERLNEYRPDTIELIDMTRRIWQETEPIAY